METGKALGIVVVVLAVIAALYIKAGAKDRFAEKVRDDVVAQLSTLPDYKSYEGLYTGLVETHYMEMFEKHLTVSGTTRRTRMTLDKEAYLDDLFLAMMADAGKQGYTKQAENIRSLRPDLGMSGGPKPPPRRRP